LAQPPAMEGNVGSILTLYRYALRIRDEHPGFAREAFPWNDARQASSPSSAAPAFVVS
jgi:hypothetical protein